MLRIVSMLSVIVQNSEPDAVSESDQPQYTELAPRSTDAASSSQNRRPPKKPVDEGNYAAVVHKANTQQPNARTEAQQVTASDTQ